MRRHLPLQRHRAVRELAANLAGDILQIAKDVAQAAKYVYSLLPDKLKKGDPQANGTVVGPDKMVSVKVAADAK